MLRQRRLEDDLLELSAIKVKLSSFQRASRYLALGLTQVVVEVVEVDSYKMVSLFWGRGEVLGDYKMGETQEGVRIFHLYIYIYIFVQVF